MSDDEASYLEQSVDFIKGQRTADKRRQARLITKIKALCDERGSRRMVEELRQELATSQEELTRMNAALGAKAPGEDIATYQMELDVRVAAAFTVINDYLLTRAEDEPSVLSALTEIGSSRSRSSGASMQSTIRLREATKNRELAELQLAQERRTVSLEKQRQELMQQQQAATLENRLERLRLEEDQAARAEAAERCEETEAVVQRARISRPAPIDSVPSPTPFHAIPGPQRADAWIEGETAAERMQTPQWSGLAACLPRLKLDEFDGNPSNWHNFISSFKAYCHDVTPVPAQRMHLLKTYLSPRVRSTVAHLLRDPERYGDALQALRRRYGDPELIDRAHVAELMAIPPMIDGSTESLAVFAGHLRDCIAALEVGSCDTELISVVNLDRTLAKIPAGTRVEWGKHVVSLRHRATLRNLDEWLEIMIKARSLGEFMDSPNQTRPEQKSNQPKQQRRINVVSRETEKCDCCGEPHHIANCTRFQGMESIEEREG